MDRRQFLKFSALLCAVATVPSCASLTPRYVLPKPLVSPGEKLLLANASIVDVQTGALRPETHVLIQGDRIAGVFGEEKLSQVTADRRIDLLGAYLMPGLINAHCHMTLPGSVGLGTDIVFAYERQLERNAEECVKHGVTTVRDMMALSGQFPKLKRKISLGQIAGPRLLSACALDVRGGYSMRTALGASQRFWQEAGNPRQGRRAVDRAVDLGANFIKLFQQPTNLLMPGNQIPVQDAPTIQAICDQAARHGLPVALHHTGCEGLTKGLAGGVTSLEHMARDGKVSDSQIDWLLRSGAIVIPTASVAFALAYEMHGDPNWGKGTLPRLVQERKRVMPEQVREFSEPELVEGTLGMFAQFSNPRSYERTRLMPWPLASFFTAAATTGTDNMLALHNAGVPFGCGNDGGVPLIWPGALTLEMTLLEESGISPGDILKMATFNNARLIRREEDLGTVEAGKLADLVVYEKNPLDTVRNTHTPVRVFQSGRQTFFYTNG